MDIAEYSAQDATGLASLIREGQVSAEEVAQTAREAIAWAGERLNCLAEGPFETPLQYDSQAPFAGAPLAIKDLVCHAAGVRTRSAPRWSARACCLRPTRI